MQEFGEYKVSPCSPETMEIVRELAMIHTEGSDAPMALIDDDPVKHKAQRSYYVPGDQLDVKEINILAKVIEPKFDELVADLSGGKQGSVIEQMGEELSAGENIALIMNHCDILDAGVGYGAVYTELKNRGYDFTTAIIGSMTLSHLGYNFTKVTEDSEPTPAPDALAWLTNHIFLSFPPSPRMLNSKLGEDSERKKQMKQHNRNVRSLLDRLLQKGGVFWIVLASGTSDRKDKDSGIVKLERLKDGTIELLTTNTSVVPAAIWRGESGLKFKLSDEPKVLTNPDEVHEMMSDIEADLNRMIPEESFDYEKSR